MVRTRKNYRATAQFKTWIFQIALNLCRDRMRRMKHRSHLSLNTPVPSQDNGDFELQELMSDPNSDPVNAAPGFLIRNVGATGKSPA